MITAMLFVVLSLCETAYAQSTASIEGQVTDQGRADVPGVEIILSGSAIGVHRKSTIDDCTVGVRECRLAASVSVWVEI
jgi:hypothetical protein